VAGTTSKRVLAVRFDREPVAGYIDPGTYLRADGIELLTPAGNVSNLPYSEVKAICFVRDFESFPGWKENRVFTSRPKSEGLWIRFVFRDGDQMDGVLSSNLLLLEAQGFSVAPADPTFQNQRVFVPKAAVTEIKVMGVVGIQVRQQRKPKPKPGQLEMFET
jgi:hypothetical protein